MKSRNDHGYGFRPGGMFLLFSCFKGMDACTLIVGMSHIWATLRILKVQCLDPSKKVMSSEGEFLPDPNIFQRGWFHHQLISNLKGFWLVRSYPLALGFDNMILGGGFKDVFLLFTPILGEMIQFDKHIFELG